MSKKASIDVMDKIKGEQSEDVLVQYGCYTCGSIFLSEELCDEHIAICGRQNTSEDPVEETNSGRAPKRKREPCTEETNSKNSFDDSTSEYSLETHPQGEQNKVIFEDIDYGATSRIISDNEILITLPYDQVNEPSTDPLDFSNEVSIGFEQHTQDLRSFQQEYDENTVIIEHYNVEDFSNTDQHDTVKILSVFTTKPSTGFYKCNVRESQEPQKDIIMETNRVETIENENNQILTVLSTVDENQLDTHGQVGELTFVDILEHAEGVGEDSFENGANKDGESIGERGGENRSPAGRETDKNKANTVYSLDNQKQSPKNKPRVELNQVKSSNTTSKEVSIKEKVKNAGLFDMVKENLNEKLKAQSPKSQTNEKLNETLKDQVAKNQTIQKRREFTNKRVKDKNNTQKNQIPQNLNNNQSKNQVLYSHIEIVKNKEPKEPDKFEVYDFFDEEEEKLKAEIQEEMKRAKEIRKRTCRFCNETFNDPIILLRHKRQYHKTDKIIMKREELKPYLKVEDKTVCPICFFFLGPKGHNSVFQKHLNTHCEDFAFECGICGMQFRRKDHWSNHESRHVVRPAEKD